MGDINVEAGLSRTLQNTRLAGSFTPATGSLFELYESSSVNQAAPHAISEFRNKSYTSSINEDSSSISIQATEEVSTGINTLRVYYRINLGVWVQLGVDTDVNITPDYTPVGSISIANGDTLYLACRNSSDQNIQFGQGTGGGFTGYCGQTSPYSFTVSSNVTVSLNASATAGEFNTC